MAPGLIGALAARTSPEAPLISLLGRVSVSHTAGRCGVSVGTARLLAYLALHPGYHDRQWVAGTLWPDASDARAAGNLRSALWRLNALPVELVDVDRTWVSLRAEVLVDVRLLSDWAARLISDCRDPDDLASVPWDVGGVELLPGWQDDWLLLERERVRQRLLHAMECLARELIGLKRCAEAVEVALVVTSADGLRESAQRILITAHLAEGNHSEARRCFNEHRELVARELGVSPSMSLSAMVDPVSAPVSDRRISAGQ